MMNIIRSPMLTESSIIAVQINLMIREIFNLILKKIDPVS